MNKSICVLLSGHAGVGKTTSARYLYNKAYDLERSVVIGSFASSLKRVARECFNWDGNKDLKGRALLQGIGQTARNYYPYIWVSNLIDKDLPSRTLYPFDFVFVDDCRFNNEVEYIKDNPLYQVYTVRIEAPNREILKGTKEYEEVSETELDYYKFDYVINNTDVYASLYKQLDVLFEETYKKNLFGG
jgi:GTPase SAR1 family protein